VTGDSYAAQWVAGAWRKAGIGYFKSELPKSQIYLEGTSNNTRFRRFVLAEQAGAALVPT
jgi:hypothetical protein